MSIVTGQNDPRGPIDARVGPELAAPIGVHVEGFLRERQGARSIAPRRDGPFTAVGPSRVHSRVRVSGGIEVADRGATLVLWVSGELGGASRDLVEVALMAAIASAGAVILDLANLTFCDSSAIAMFIAAIDTARADGRCLTVRHALPQVRRAFETTRPEITIDLID